MPTSRPDTVSRVGGWSIWVGGEAPADVAAAGAQQAADNPADTGDAAVGHQQKRRPQADQDAAARRSQRGEVDPVNVHAMLRNRLARMPAGGNAGHRQRADSMDHFSKQHGLDQNENTGLTLLSHYFATNRHLTKTNQNTPPTHTYGTSHASLLRYTSETHTTDPPAGDPARDGSSWTRLPGTTSKRSIRLPSMSTTSKRQPFHSRVSPTFGM
jgi:hypothetical protein